MVENYRNIIRNMNRGGKAQKDREQKFNESNFKLFDIAHKNALSMISIPEDVAFLVDQRNPSCRNMFMEKEDTALYNKERKKIYKLSKDAGRKEKEEERLNESRETVEWSMSSASSNEGTDEDLYKGLTQASSSGYLHTPSKILMLDSNTASALDRTCVSDRNAMYVLSAAAKSMGHSLGEVTLSRSTIRRARMSNRQKTSLAIKEGFKNDCCQHLVIHWDGKICPAIEGAAKREDRIAIVVTGNHTEKLLAVPKVAQGTGSLVADTVKQSVDDWDLGEKIVGMSFDTTASNTGRFNGSCVLLEEKLDRQLLWLPCRHHVHEIICGDVFRSLFGHSQAPTISIFKRFQESWSKINKDAYEACTDTRLDSSLNSLKIKSVAFAKDILSRDEYGTLTTRDDYKELLEMCLVFLGEKSPDISFKQPGAFHHARWMAKVIYVLKIYCFRSQFLMTKREEACCLEFGLFAALLYSESWFRCALIADAPANDRSLFQILKGYHTTNPIVSKAGIAALKRHLWYLGEELIPLALFAENNVVSCSTKAKIVEALKSYQNTNLQRSVRFTRDEDITNYELENFVGAG